MISGGISSRYHAKSSGITRNQKESWESNQDESWARIDDGSILVVVSSLYFYVRNFIGSSLRSDERNDERMMAVSSRPTLQLDHLGGGNCSQPSRKGNMGGMDPDH